MKRLLLLAVMFASIAAAAQPKVLSHRGFYTNPKTDENTIKALKQGQKAGLWGMEFDVHKTADGELMIFHNNNVNEQLSCQHSNWSDMKKVRLEHGQKIPTLDQWLRQAKKTPGIIMALELKAHDTPEKETEVIEDILKLVRQYDMMDQMAFLSFSKHACLEFRRLAPESYVVLNASKGTNPLSPEACKALGINALSYEKAVFKAHPEYITRAKELGLDTYYWMVDTEEELDWAIEHGTTHLTSNFPDKMEEMIKAKTAVR